MGLEVASFVGDLVSSNPLGTDTKSQGDDHIRLIKSVLQATFPLATGAYAFGTNLATFTSTTAGASDGPTIDLHRNKASAVNDIIGAIQFNGLSSTGVKRQYAKTSVDIRDNTNTSEDASWYVDIMVAGVSERTIGARFDFTGFGPNSQTGHSLGRNDNDGYLEFHGGNVAGGGVIRVYSSAHATQARDIQFFSNNTQKYIYDFSAVFHQFDDLVYFNDRIRINQNSTDSPGSGNNTQGFGWTQASSRLSINANGAAHQIGRAQDGAIVSWNSGGGSSGSVAIAGPTTTYNTSSDKKKKKNWRKFDAEGIIKELEVWLFDWKDGSGIGYGVLAQDAINVFPPAITYDKETKFWGADYSKYVPLLIQLSQSLLGRVEQLEKKGKQCS